MLSHINKKHHSMTLGLLKYLRNLALFIKEVTILAAGQIALFVDRTLLIAEATLLKSLPKPKNVCDFPCEEHCEELICTLIREVYPGECVLEPVYVRNLGKCDKEFIFQPMPLESFGGENAGLPIVDPEKTTLKAGETVLVKISYETKSFQPGKRYTADIKVDGYCEQLIRLTAHAISHHAAKCIVAQKEYLKRHSWHDHFYCDDTEKDDEEKKEQKKLEKNLKGRQANQ